MRNWILSVVICWLTLSLSCARSKENLEILITKLPEKTLGQFDLFHMEFQVNQAIGNPYDPHQIDVYLEIETPSGKKIQHPSFFKHKYEIVFDYGHEVARKLAGEHWETKWTPSEVGAYRWKLIAKNHQRECSTSGTLECTPSSAKGFVRVASSDNKYFETADGDFFYPVGHVTRSPFDDRGEQTPFNTDTLHEPIRQLEAAGAARVAKYAQWFQQMSASGENFCTIWMAPWWLELEWSPTREGYGGLHHYNQKHAAQLDQILALAEKHGIYILLFTTNHGRLSTVVDSEWYANPHFDPKGKVDSPSKFIESDECLQAELDRHRYILARWGYSRSLLGLSLCTEANWLDPYFGFRADPDAFSVEGMMTPREPIRRDHEGVKRWFTKLATGIREMDVHQHILSIQFANIAEGREFWESPEFEVVLNNAYTNQLRVPELERQLGRPVEGIADGMLAWSRSMSTYEKPTLVSEWGGDFFTNHINCIDSELHLGAWAMSMTQLGGVSGFWWANEVDRANMYRHFSALSAFWKDYDRRNKNLESEPVNVMLKRTSFRDASSHTDDLDQTNASDLFVSHPSRSGVMLFNESEAFAYIYHRHANTSDVPALSGQTPLFPIEREAHLLLPSRIAPGEYEIEFWDTFEGTIASTEHQILPPGDLQPRYIELPSFRVDLAIKLKQVSSQTNHLSEHASK